MPLPSKQRSILTATLQGLGLWICLYILVVHLFVVWKWQSGAPYEVALSQLSVGQEQNGDLAMTSHHDDALDDDDDDDQEPIIEEVKVYETRRLDTISRHEENVRMTIDSLQKAIQAQAATRKVLDSQSDKVATMVDNLNTNIRLPVKDEEWSTGSTGGRTRNLYSLLSEPELHSMGDFQLERKFAQVQNDLQLMISENATTRWEHLLRVLKPETKYAPKRKSIATAKCATPSSSSLLLGTVAARNASALVDDDDDDVALVTDLTEYSKTFDDIFQRRQAGAGVTEALLPETFRLVQRMSVSHIQRTLQSFYKSMLNKQSSSDKICITEEQVIEMMDQGLAALHLKSDLRSALRSHVMKLDPNASSIILDAIFPLSQPERPKSDTINLRKALDSEMTVKAAGWIDQVAELLGGHNDAVDRFLDSIAETSDARLGEVVMKKVMDQAGRINMPHPRKVLEKLPDEVRHRLVQV